MFLVKYGHALGDICDAWKDKFVVVCFRGFYGKRRERKNKLEQKRKDLAPIKTVIRV